MIKPLNEILKDLNPQQLTAVEQIDGPVMVVAGPGTGKTQILSARIANILTKTDTDPRNILCLTYTDAGVRAMRERLISMIGTTAYSVRINTFHSLGAEIIRENEERFGGKGLQPISDLEKEQLLRSLLDDLPSSSPLKTGKDYYYQTKPVSNILNIIKSEGLNIDEYNTFIDNYITQMPEMEEFQYKRNSGKNQKGDPKVADIKKVSDNLMRLKEVMQLFPVYNQKRRDMRRFDFDDMLSWVKQAFEEDEMFLRLYQEQFLYYLVDEFQDTNGIQAQLLNLLAGKENNPNVFVVGDDDQSIYSFQGANYKRMLDFATTYQENLIPIVLQKNYRSSQNILDASGALIAANTERLLNQFEGLTKDLEACNDLVKDLPNKPLLMQYANETQEAVAISDRIEKLIKDEGVLPENIAIIYRQHKQAEEISRYLMFKNVPLYAVRAVNILEEPLIQNLLMVLEYIHKESKEAFSGEELIFGLMHLEFFGLEPIDIARFAEEISKKRSRWRSAIADKCKDNPQEKLFAEDAFITNLKKFHREMEHWLKQSSNFTVAELVEKVIAKGGFLAHAIASEDKNWNLQVLKTFFDHVKDEMDRNPTLRLSAFLHDLKTMQELNIRIEIKRIYGTEKGVNMITAHSSKGLEFDHVFMLGCTSKIWSEKDRKLPFDMNLIFQKKNESKSSDEESRRLFYVAMTRARKTLQVSWSTEKDNASVFVTELINGEKCEQVNSIPEDALTAGFIEAQFVQPEAVQNKLVEDAWLDRFVSNYTMSVTHLNEFLKCPVTFYYQRVLRVPTAKNMHIGFGSAIHDTLEAWLKNALGNPDRAFWPLPKLLSEFERWISYQRSCFTDENYKHMIEKGKEVLTNYYNNRLEHLQGIPKMQSERRFLTQLGDLPITGSADRIDIYEDHVNIIDYKTGKPENGKKKLSPPIPDAAETDSFEKRFGGDYWRQLTFYKILVDLSPDFSYKMQSAEVEFVEDEDYTPNKVFVTDEDTDIVLKQIEHVKTRIRNKDFRKGCGQEDCHWCNFEKQYLHGRNYAFESLPEDELI